MFLHPIWSRVLGRQPASVALEPRTENPPLGSEILGKAALGEVALGAAAEAVAALEPAIVQARLFGSFELRLDGVPVTGWNGSRGVSVLRYLLSRRRYGCSRDELLEAFWPDVAPAAARNRLQVAVSGLRRTLLEATNLQVIEYAQGGYRLNPALRIDVDVQEFEHLLRGARAAERATDLGAAASGYRAAIALYRGDFAADAPFEQWTLLPRESHRITLVDAMDRLSRIEYQSGDLDGCIRTAHRMLDVDPCREDAHRLLMRCYADQGRGYQAVRQYDFCRRVLSATLETGPSTETTALYRRIRAGGTRRPALID